MKSRVPFAAGYYAQPSFQCQPNPKRKWQNLSHYTNEEDIPAVPLKGMKFIG